MGGCHVDVQVGDEQVCDSPSGHVATLMEGKPPCALERDFHMYLYFLRPFNLQQMSSINPSDP